LSKDQSAHLRTSVEKFGLIDKPIINVDGMIIGGHQRLNVLKRLGFKEAECWAPDVELSSEQVNELNIRLNKNTGEFDWECLANEWDADLLIEWGFSESDLTGEEVVSKKKKQLRIILEFDSQENIEECASCDELYSLITRFGAQVKVKK